MAIISRYLLMWIKHKDIDSEKYNRQSYSTFSRTTEIGQRECTLKSDATFVDIYIQNSLQQWFWPVLVRSGTKRNDPQADLTVSIQNMDIFYLTLFCLQVLDCPSHYDGYNDDFHQLISPNRSVRPRDPGSSRLGFQSSIS